VCGPEGFIDHVVSAATEQWWANETIHVEHFGATAPQVGDKAFTVVLASSGKEIYVPEDCSMADMLIANGANLSVSCEQGLCGTCLVPVLSGVPDHRDIYQTDDQKAANTHVTPCCSRSRSERLVLDL
jgi:vanillate O-demethylase ferredoxin subunit